MWVTGAFARIRYLVLCERGVANRGGLGGDSVANEVVPVSWQTSEVVLALGRVRRVRVGSLLPPLYPRGGGVPPRIHVNHVVRSSQVEPHAAGLQRDEKRVPLRAASPWSRIR